MKDRCKITTQQEAMSNSTVHLLAKAKLNCVEELVQEAKNLSENHQQRSDEYAQEIKSLQQNTMSRITTIKQEFQSISQQATKDIRLLYNAIQTESNALKELMSSLTPSNSNINTNQTLVKSPLPLPPNLIPVSLRLLHPRNCARGAKHRVSNSLPKWSRKGSPLPTSFPIEKEQ